MKRLLLICFLFSPGFSSSAQYIKTLHNEDGYLQKADGSLVQKLTSFTEEGSSSLPEKNCLVVLKTKNGKVYNKVNGRIDLPNEGFIFSVNQQEFMCSLALDEIVFDSCDATLSGAVFKTGYPSIDKQNEKSFYQILSQGKATLLKHYAVKWQDLIPFNNTNTTRKYTQVQQYYLFLNGKMTRLEKNKDNLPALLGSLKEYIVRNNLNLKKDEDAAEVVDYYNSL
jgi:hypothetical protein